MEHIKLTRHHQFCGRLFQNFLSLGEDRGEGQFTNRSRLTGPLASEGKEVLKLVLAMQHLHFALSSRSSPFREQCGLLL